MVRSLSGQGGTMMIEGIKAALDFPHDPNRLRVCRPSSPTASSATKRDPRRNHRRRWAHRRIFSFGVGLVAQPLPVGTTWLKWASGAVAYLSLNDKRGRGHGRLLRADQLSGHDRRPRGFRRAGGPPASSPIACRTCSSAGRSSSQPFQGSRPGHHPNQRRGRWRETPDSARADRTNAPTLTRHPGRLGPECRSPTWPTGPRGQPDFDAAGPRDQEVALEYGLMSDFHRFRRGGQSHPAQPGDHGPLWPYRCPFLRASATIPPYPGNNEAGPSERAASTAI